MKSESAIRPGSADSFNVLVRHLQSLCLDVEVVQSQQDLIETAVATDRGLLLTGTCADGRR